MAKARRKDAPEGFRDAKSLLATIVGNHLPFYQSGGAEAEIRPMVFAVCKNGDVIPILAQFDDEDSKDNFVAGMAAQFKKWNVTHFAFATKADAL